jgi:hypothetical protein
MSLWIAGTYIITLSTATLAVEFVPDGSGQPKSKKTLIYFDSIAALGAFLFHLRNLLFFAGVGASLHR